MAWTVDPWKRTVSQNTCWMPWFFIVKETITTTPTRPQWLYVMVLGNGTVPNQPCKEFRIQSCHSLQNRAGQEAFPHATTTCCSRRTSSRGRRRVFSLEQHKTLKNFKHVKEIIEHWRNKASTNQEKRVAWLSVMTWKEISASQFLHLYTFWLDEWELSERFPFLNCTHIMYT